MAHDATDVSKVPNEVLGLAAKMLQAAAENTARCGITKSFGGFALESHTLGCRDAAGDDASDFWDKHWEIYDDYTADGISFVIGDPGDGVFVTITPQRKNPRRR